MKKLNYSEFQKSMLNYNEHHSEKEGIYGVIVFTEDTFNQPYSLESRSYKVSSDNKAFIYNTISNSIWGDSLDGSDMGVKLSDYIRSGWKIDYCYLIEI